MGMAAILVTWPGPFEQTIIFTTNKSSKWKLASMDLAALQQLFECVNLSDLGQKSNNVLDLWYSYEFMFSLRRLLTFTSQTAMVSIKSSI